MKKDFYVHGHSEPVDLYEDSQIIKENWGNRDNLKYPETTPYYEIYHREDYFNGVCNIKQGDVVVDCGGNVGIFASYANDLGASRVLSFEPFINNFEINKKNNPTLEVFNLAVSNKSNETIELLYTETGNGGHSIMQSELERDPGHFEHKNLYVKTITLDDIIAENFIDHIDFLKVDTEGAELLIFQGLSDENLDKIRCISLEYHHSMFNYDDEIYNNFQKRFMSRGFNVCTWILDRYTRMTYIAKGDVFTENPNHFK